MKISQNKNGKYLIDFTSNGRRIRRIIGSTKRQAEAAAATLKADIIRDQYGLVKPRKQVFFEKLADKYYDQYSKIHKKSHQTDHFHILRLKSYFKGKFILSITSDLIEKYSSKRIQEVSNSTVNRELACLKHIFTKAIEWGMIENNPVKKIRMLKEVPKERRVLNSDERARLIYFIEKSENVFLRLFVIIGLNTGMRPSEILSLKWKNVKFKDQYILIENSKSSRSRKVPMNNIVLNSFKDLKQDHDHIFFNKKTKSHIKGIKKSFKTACEEAKIEEATPYCLRHTAITIMVNELGIDIVTVGKIVGHSKVEMTKRYCHPSDDIELMAVMKLGEALEKPRHKVDTPAQIITSRNSVSSSYLYN